MPYGGVSYASSQSEADRRVHKAWNEDPPNTGPEPPAGMRRWALQSLFGKQCRSVDDLRLLADMTRFFDCNEAQKQDGFDVQREANGLMSLGNTWSDKSWPGDLEWQTTAADQVVQWELTCTVFTGFIGKGPLAGYNELRRFKAHAVITMDGDNASGDGSKLPVGDPVAAGPGAPAAGSG